MSAVESKENDSLEIDELEQLLLAAEAEEASIKEPLIIEASAPCSARVSTVKPQLSLEGSTFLKNLDHSNSTATNTNLERASIVHNGDNDSSDEETQNFLERKYNEYGRHINKILKQKEEEKVDVEVSRFINRTFIKAESVTSKAANKAVRVKNQVKFPCLAYGKPLKHYRRFWSKTRFVCRNLKPYRV